jgi:1-acyl-sn-glycerol-3-phosphate acyltransferase
MPYTGLLTMTPGRSRILYMEEVPVKGLVMADLPALKQQVYTLMQRKLIEYKAAWITPKNN